MTTDRRGETLRTAEVDLRALFALDSGPSDALVESFISQRLFEANVWESPRTSDGIEHLRIVECEPERVRVSGRIFTIDQTLHSSWLDIERSDRGVTWALYFDSVASSPRRARNAIDTFDQATDINWRVTLTGLLEIRDGTLVVA